jgi:tRNA (cmo5U34)-methyltransferase
MTSPETKFADQSHVTRYIENGPSAFTPGHSGMLQMSAVLLGETMEQKGELLIVGAGGGLEIKSLAGTSPDWTFMGVDPAPAMLDLARTVAGPIAGERMTLIEGTVHDAPAGPFDAATCMLVLALLNDDGSKLDLLKEVKRRLKPSAPLILVDQCIDLKAADADRWLSRYADFARLSGVDSKTIAAAKQAISGLESMVPASRNEELLQEAGFEGVERFYTAMAWYGWVAYV